MVIAQLGEHSPCKRDVVGSNPTGSTICRFSSTGRASALQAEGHKFKSCNRHYRNVAQLVECVFWEHEVVGSRPAIPTYNFIWCWWRNWQTRQIVVLVGVILYEFKSHPSPLYIWLHGLMASDISLSS